MSALVWVDDVTGYRCPQCHLFVCIPRRADATCPRCPASQPLDERLSAALTDAGFDETDVVNAVEAIMPILVARSRVPADTDTGRGQ